MEQDVAEGDDAGICGDRFGACLVVACEFVHCFSHDAELSHLWQNGTYRLTMSVAKSLKVLSARNDWIGFGAGRRSWAKVRGSRFVDSDLGFIDVLAEVWVLDGTVHYQVDAPVEESLKVF